MNILTTFFRRDDSELVPGKLEIGYPQSIDSINTGGALSTIYLQWTPNKEVVSLPKESFYISTGKRLIDLTISLLVFVFILSWLIPVIGVLILAESRGPILFMQNRSGRKGEPFLCLKFRTMQHTPNQQGKFQQTARGDNRVTAIGRFLRRTNLDEMPQFINVLIGDMSLVGPRPHAVPHDALHWDSPAYRERYWVRPGITGLAQVRGSRGETSNEQRMEHRVRYDHLYIRNQTFGLDMKICARTLNLMLKGDRNA